MIAATSAMLKRYYAADICHITDYASPLTLVLLRYAIHGCRASAIIHDVIIVAVIVDSAKMLAG